MAKSPSQQSVLSSLSQLETTLDLYFNKKAPALPAGIKEFVVAITPYGTILGAIFAVPAVLALLGIIAVFATMILFSGGWGIRSVVSLFALIVTTILYVMAIPGLFKRRKEAWDKMFWVSLIQVVVAVVSMNVFSLVVGTAISWYFLFQVRSYYK